MKFIKLLSSLLAYIIKPVTWKRAVRNPRYLFRSILLIIKHPVLFIITKRVKGYVDFQTGIFLYESVLKTRNSAPPVLEIGAFHGLSTIFISRAAKAAGKRVKSLESFTGIPEADAVLDKKFLTGNLVSDVSKYEYNLRSYGVRDVVDLIVGDARATLLPTITDTGFSLVFLDVDTYIVMSDLLRQLWRQAKGGEIIIVHDADSPGVRKAINEFHQLSGNTVAEKTLLYGTTVELRIPADPIK